MRSRYFVRKAMLFLTILFAGMLAQVKANTSTTSLSDQSPVPANEITGVVSGPRGRESGVWVIAETSELPTTFRKIVVTDERGRFLLPDLPRANYSVWTRGYGLSDSKPVNATPGTRLALTALPAPDAQTAARIYPGNYWLSLIKVPSKQEFPMYLSGSMRQGGRPSQSGGESGGNPEAVVNRDMSNQETWIETMKSGCEACHQLGDKSTREIEPELGQFDSSAAAWDRRVKSGQAGPFMSSAMSQFAGRQRGLAMYSDWTDRIAAGETPHEVPPRPQGIERNLVLTEWSWSGPTGWIHDEIATDKRNPTANANGRIYGSAVGAGAIAILDPRTNSASMLKVPVQEDAKGMKMFQSVSDGFEASPYWGEAPIWTDLSNLHNPMIDQKGRLWVASSIRADVGQPAFCKQGSGNPYAEMFPIARSGRQVVFYDFANKKWTGVDTCFGTHHVQFSEDEDNTVFFSGSDALVGWINTRVLDETHNEEKAQGWCPAYIDSNGNGRYDPKSDELVRGGAYGIIVNPVDKSIWYSVRGVPGKIVRIDRGLSPPLTCRTEVYEPPFGNIEPNAKEGFAPRGIDVDRNGVIWTSLSASGQLASFDRRKCKVIGVVVTGQDCREGWTLYKAPGPELKGTNGISADFLYFDWVDQFNCLGLGKNIPIATGSGSDSLLVLDPKTSRWTVLRVPYPLGFYARGLDGRIDDRKRGWKGRGLWATYGTIPNWHIEGGKGTTPILVHFQLRPSPLAN